MRMTSRFSEEFAGGPQDMLESMFGVQVTYSRGEDSVTLTAIVDMLDYEDEDGSGHYLRRRIRDFIIPVVDLVLNGSAVLPVRGDTIAETIGDYVYTYTVLDLPGEPHFVYDDQDNARLLIHTEQTAREDA